ncbi:MAG: hypothetical protein IMZ69_06290, partial [Spirochaetes bacterium]|nr:hypothetical protein [Spirochaetota bacterium]
MAQKKRAPNKGKGSRTTSAQSSRSTRTPAGCLFWLVLLAVVIAVAVAAREPIKATFVRYFGKKTESARGGSGAPSAPAVTPAAQPADAPAIAAPEKLSKADEIREPKADEIREPAKTATKPPGANAGPVLRRARLHFIAVDPDGTTKT